MDRGFYNPSLAGWTSLFRAQSRCPQLKIDASAWKVIENHLAIRWSPFQIADFLQQRPKDDTVVAVSENTIYLHFHMKGELKKLALRELRQKRRKRTKKGEETRGRLVNTTLIDERAVEANDRTVPGHWEGGLIIAKDHNSALSVIVER
jgi:IS30 family transposase